MRELFIICSICIILFTAGCSPVGEAVEPTPTQGRCGFGGCGEDIVAKQTEQAGQSSAAPTAVKGCGDGICEGSENEKNCPLDCGSYGGMHPKQTFAGRCGDTVCEGPETSALCPEDCLDTNEYLSSRTGVVAEIDQRKYYQGSGAECWDKETLAQSTQTAFTEFIDTDTGSAEAVLYFTVIVHIEAHEAYEQEQAYRENAERLRRVAGIIAAHGGVMTVQIQPPFIETAAALDDPIFQELAGIGNEIALHFHENEYVGNENVDRLPPAVYVDALNKLVQRIEAVTGVVVENWSGANTYIHIFEAASQVGLKTNTNYKNRYTQGSAPGFTVLNPWRPAGAANMEERMTHDPDGAVIYIPSGVFPVHCTKLEAVPRPYGYEAFDYVSAALRASLDAAAPGMVNTFYITFHPGDFLNPPDDEHDYAVWDAWLTQVVDPLVAAGRIQWATIAEMADAFEAWEAAAP